MNNAFSIKSPELSVRFALVFFFISGLLYSSAWSSDYILLSSPRQFIIYNQYEQPLSTQEYAQLLPGIPLRIIDRSVKLGDQITIACKAEMSGRTCFILAGSSQPDGEIALNRQIISGCTTIDDTMTVATPSALSLLSPTNQRGSCIKGERVIRAFERSGRFYVLFIKQKRYFWCTASANADPFGKIINDETGSELVSETLDPKIHDQLITRMEGANNAMEALFGHFNKTTNTDRSIPRWTLLEQGAELVWTLNNPYRTSGALFASTRYLVSDLEGVLLGKHHTVKFYNGTITVAPVKEQP